MNIVNKSFNAFKLINDSSMTDLNKHFFTGPVKTYIHFGLAPSDIPYSDEERTFRVNCLNEEYEEFINAVNDNNRDEKTDAIVDLLIFAIGTSYRMDLLSNSIECYPVINCSAAQYGFTLSCSHMDEVHIKSLGFILDQLNSSNRNDIFVIDQLIAYCIHYLSANEKESTLFEYYDRVVTANMSKVVGPMSKRGSFAIDLVKPEGWTAPNFKGIFR